MKRIHLSLILSFIAVAIFAQEPSGYYSAAEGKTQAALKTALSTIISANAVDKGYDFLYTIYETSDNLPNGKVWDMYSIKADGTANYFFTHNSTTCGTYNSEGDCYNREHTFCDSWLGAASPQRSDAHHILPTDGYVNNRRSSYPHGKVGSAIWTSTNGSKLGTSDASTGYGGTVFEPIDAFKGDFARMYFYVATRYESKIAGWVNNGSAKEILDGTSYPAYKSWFYNLMLTWSRMDPVSQKEINRNNAIYAYQKNRNPFIDHPELAEYIWGNKMGTNWSLNANTDPVLSSPANGSTVDFGTVNYQQNNTKNISVLGSNLTGDLALALSGTNAAYFSISATTISKANAQTGYALTITYNAPVIGTHSAVLTISGGGVTTATVNLTGTAVSCQNLNFSVPFSTAMEPFTQYSVSGDQVWTWKSAAYGVAMSGFVNSVNNANEDWLISPSINLSNYENVTLSFEHAINFADLTKLQSEHTVWVSNNYTNGNPNTASWTQLTIPTYPTGSDWTFVKSGNIQIPNNNSLANSTIAFKYLSDNVKSSTWEIKNITLTGMCKSTGITTNTVSIKHTFSTIGREITISNLENEPVHIYDIYGRNIKHYSSVSDKLAITLPAPGIYLIKAGSETWKTIIK